MRRMVALLVACALLLTGCVDIPTSGPAEPVQGQAPPCQNCVNIEVAPPSYGDEPRQIVEGYLRATSIYQPNYSVAKQYLTASAAEKWSPEDGAQIYRGSPVATGKSTVILDGTLQGALGPDRSYTAYNSPRRWDFGVVNEDGQWRISTPPDGLMIAEYLFSRFYASYNLYFLGNATLVPDPIFLPILPSQANVASVLMKALVNGPSRWLKPAVSSAIPADTDLNVGAVTVENGVAVVPLSEAALRLNDRKRSQLAAQVVYTLRTTGINSVLFQVNQKPFPVPEGDDDSFEVPVDSIETAVNPVPAVAGEQLYAVRGRSVQLVDTSGGSPSPQAMAGPLGAGKYEIDSLAVSVGNTDIAVVTGGASELRAGLTTTGEPALKLSQVTRLLRPQYSRYGELWAIGDSAGRQRLWLSNGAAMTEVAAPVLAGGRITAFRISPDGTRMALVRQVGRRNELGVARVTRVDADSVTVDGWRVLETSQQNASRLSVIGDVGWLTANTLLVLGAATASAPLLPYQISQDAAVITASAEANTGDAVELAVLLGSDTSVFLDGKGQLFTDDGTQWLALVNGCRTMAFPG